MDPKTIADHFPPAVANHIYQFLVFVALLKMLDTLFKWIIAFFRGRARKAKQNTRLELTAMEQMGDSIREFELATIAMKKEHREEVAELKAEIAELKNENAKLRASAR